MTDEYMSKFKFRTHIETEAMPVAASCNVTVEKFSHDSIRVLFDSNDEDLGPMVFVDINESGIPEVTLCVGLEDPKAAVIRIHLLNGQWVIVDTP